MAKKNKKGGWTGASSSSARGGRGPKVYSAEESKAYGSKRSKVHKIAVGLIFLLVCVLVGNMIYQAAPKSMAKYWGLESNAEEIVRIVITTYSESGDKQVTEYTEPEDVSEFGAVLESSTIHRLWSAEEEDTVFTAMIQIYLEGQTEASYEAGLANERIYFLGMPTYDWYLDEEAPLFEYIE